VSLLAHVAERLEAERVPFVLIGAAAMAAHGVSRSTADLDLFTTDPRLLDGAFWQHWDHGVDVRRGDVDDPLAGVVRIVAAGERDIDIVVGKSAWQEPLVHPGATVAVGDAAVPVVSLVGLVLLKLYAGGSQDRWDIEQLLAANERSEVDAAVDARIGDLPVDARQLWNVLRDS
jgi:predicted nucleotidyltransferase